MSSDPDEVICRLCAPVSLWRWGFAAVIATVGLLFAMAVHWWFGGPSMEFLGIAVGALGLVLVVFFATAVTSRWVVTPEGIRVSNSFIHDDSFGQLIHWEEVAQLQRRWYGYRLVSIDGFQFAAWCFGHPNGDRLMDEWGARAQAILATRVREDLDSPGDIALDVTVESPAVIHRLIRGGALVLAFTYFAGMYLRDIPMPIFDMPWPFMFFAFLYTVIGFQNLIASRWVVNDRRLKLYSRQIVLGVRRQAEAQWYEVKTLRRRWYGLLLECENGRKYRVYCFDSPNAELVLGEWARRQDGRTIDG